MGDTPGVKFRVVSANVALLATSKVNKVDCMLRTLSPSVSFRLIIRVYILNCGIIATLTFD